MRRFWPLLVVPVAGCSPSQNILGSYFPSWLLCLAAAAAATAVFRQVLVMAGLERHLILPALTYLAVAAGVSMGFWLVSSGL